MSSSDRWKEIVRPRRIGRRSRRSFYDDDSLTESERIELRKAAKVENLDEEIALLRLRLKKALSEQPEDYALLVGGMNVLVRAVAAQYRLSPRAKKDLTDNFAAVLNSLGDHLLPADR